MSCNKWGYIGYGIAIYDLSEGDIDHQKLKNLFLANKYNINEEFGLDNDDIQKIRQAQSTDEILELKPLANYQGNKTGYNYYKPLIQIVQMLLNQKDYGFEIAEENNEDMFIYIPACMPWEMGNLKDLTKEKLDSFVNEALKEIYKEECYNIIPKMDYINCVKG